LQEAFANTGKGTKIVGAMCDYINRNREQDEFDDYIQQQNSKYPIEDGYFTAEELIRDLEPLDESKENEFDEFKKKFIHYAEDCVSNLKNDLLQQLGLNVRIDTDYVFKNNWIAAYIGNKSNENLITIGLNTYLAYDKLKNSNDFNLKAQAYISITHEIGHGLVKWIEDNNDGENEKVNEFIKDLYDGEIDEEELVEEFGETAFPEATKRFSCELEDILYSLINSKNLSESLDLMSSHGHSQRKVGDLRFHKRIFWPGLDELCKKAYMQHQGHWRPTTSCVAKTENNPDRAHQYNVRKMVELANNIDFNNAYIYEALTTFDIRNKVYIIRRFCVQVPYDDRFNIGIVFAPEFGNKIMTAYLNKKSDTQQYPNENLYIKSKQDRIDTVNKYIEMGFYDSPQWQ
jgi:hypothetical protein